MQIASQETAALVDGFYESPEPGKRPQSVFFKIEQSEGRLYSVQHKHLPKDTVGLKRTDLVVRK